MVYPGNNTTNNTTDHNTKNRAQQRKAGHQQPRTEQPADALYTFPEQQFTGTQLRELLSGSSSEERAQAVTNLLSFTPWSDIWTQVSKEEVRDMFPHLKLPEGLRKAWAQLLQLPED